MPKKVKILPENRAEWTFGGLLFWHFFIHGTRPDLDPDDPIGRLWSPKEVFAAVQAASPRTFWGCWVDDKHYPSDTRMIERALFGDRQDNAAERAELREKHRLGQAAIEEANRHRRMAQTGNPQVEIIPPNSPVSSTGSALVPAGTDAENPAEDMSDEEAATSLPVVWRAALAGYKERPAQRRAPRSEGTLTVGEAIRLKWRFYHRESSPPDPRNQAQSTSGRVYAIAGVATLFVLAGAYVFVQRNSPSLPFRDAKVTTEKAPEPVKEVAATIPTPPTGDEKRLAEDRRIRMEAVLATEERQKREAAADRQAAIDRDAAQQNAEATRQDRDDNARRVAEPGLTSSRTIASQAGPASAMCSPTPSRIVPSPAHATAAMPSPTSRTNL